MANQARLGFIPSDANRFKPRKYTMTSGWTNANSLVGLAPGDPVKAVTNNTVLPLEAGDTANVLGVVASVSYRDSTGTRVYGSYVPTGTTYTGDADVLNPFAIYVWVWDQPDIEYIAPIVSASATALTNFQTGFANMPVTATSATSIDTFYKRSLRGLDFSNVAKTAKQFRILDIVRSPSQDYGATFLRAKCMITQGLHPFFQAAGV